MYAYQLIDDMAIVKNVRKFVFHVFTRTNEIIIPKINIYDNYK